MADEPEDALHAFFQTIIEEQRVQQAKAFEDVQQRAADFNQSLNQPEQSYFGRVKSAVEGLQDLRNTVEETLTK
jgi:hypothetical protein